MTNCNLLIHSHTPTTQNIGFPGAILQPGVASMPPGAVPVTMYDTMRGVA